MKTTIFMIVWATLMVFSIAPCTIAVPPAHTEVPKSHTSCIGSYLFAVVTIQTTPSPYYLKGVARGYEPMGVSVSVVQIFAKVGGPHNTSQPIKC